jgi:hypothetical protein
VRYGLNPLGGACCIADVDATAGLSLSAFSLAASSLAASWMLPRLIVLKAIRTPKKILTFLRIRHLPSGSGL